MSIPIQLVPYTRLLKRLFLGQNSLQAVAYQQDILCPEEKATLRPALFLPGQVERVKDYKATDAVAVTTKKKEIVEAVSTTVTYAPAIAYHIKDAVLFDGSIYVGRFKHPIADSSLFHLGSRKLSHINSCALASTYLGTKFFGHWLLDDCTKYLLAEEISKPLCLRMPPYGHLQQYESYFGQDWSPTDRAHIDHLVIFQDFAQNSLKRNRYKILRDRIRARFTRNTPQTLIYLRRGTTGVRRIIQNEDKIIDGLIKRGFFVLDIAIHSLEHIIEKLSNAKMVVSLEGSHNDHCALACPENSGLLVLQPADRFAAFQRAWCECIGIRYGFVVGEAQHAGYDFSLSEILRTVELMLNEIET